MEIENYNYKVEWLKERGFEKHPKQKYLYQIKIGAYDENDALISCYLISIDLLNDEYFVSPLPGRLLKITSEELEIIKGVYDIARKTYYKMNKDAKRPYSRLMAAIYGATKWTKKSNG